MLDGADPLEVPPRVFDHTRSLLSGFDKVAVEHPLTRGPQPPMPQLDGPHEARGSSSDDDSPEVETIRKQANEDFVRPAEIPDSQEQRTAKPPTLSQGKRTTFDDGV